jgi:hypothetical protein
LLLGGWVEIQGNEKGNLGTGLESCTQGWSCIRGEREWRSLQQIVLLKAAQGSGSDILVDRIGSMALQKR